jgi:hypothetical protein
MGIWENYPASISDMPVECEECEVLDCADWCKMVLDLYKPAREQE